MILEKCRLKDFEVKIAGTSVWIGSTNPRVSFSFESQIFLDKLIYGASSLEIIEDYLDGRIEVNGDFRYGLRVVYELLSITQNHTFYYMVRKYLHWIRATSNKVSWLPGQRGHNIKFHYDLPVEFWREWLDPKLVYSCAYFRSKDIDISQAQVEKLDYICRKLELRKGDRLLDIGCGWGALLEHAICYYGVRGEGLTLSERQAVYCEDRLRKLGGGSAKIMKLDFFDYRPEYTYDKIVSVGMIEHVEKSCQRPYFSKARSLLHRDGLFLNHGITINPSVNVDNGGLFIGRYIFPGYFLENIGNLIMSAECSGFEIRDVESLRAHYDFTLQYWGERFNRSIDRCEQYMDRRRLRAFKLYLFGTGLSFAVGELNIYQCLLSPERVNIAEPVTRDRWYTKAEAIY